MSILPLIPKNINNQQLRTKMWLQKLITSKKRVMKIKETGTDLYLFNNLLYFI